MAARRDKDQGRTRRVSRIRTETSIDEERGVFMISVAAELAEMHPQTLRMYEARGLITPKRSPKNTRLYSQADVERLRKIQHLTSEEGLNLAGVETVLELEQRVEKMRAEMARLRKRAAEVEKQMAAEVERLRGSLGGELVPYGAYEPEKLTGDKGSSSTRTPVRRRTDSTQGADS
jgi:MerR family transcriptional regulator, heat shock protein HspR